MLTVLGTYHVLTRCICAPHVICLMCVFSHANIVGYCGKGHAQTPSGPRFFISIERLNGGTLLTMLSECRSRNSRPFSTRKLLEHSRSLADALSYLHEGFHPAASVIHRDIKPVFLIAVTGHEVINR